MYSADEVKTEIPRLFLFEPGWRVGLKSGSEREFCYSIAPGQNHYHRLMDGEIFLQRVDEKICLPCAARRGLLAFDPKVLREALTPENFVIDSMLEEFDVVLREDS
jgi:hypothetical protein